MAARGGTETQAHPIPSGPSPGPQKWQPVTPLGQWGNNRTTLPHFLAAQPDQVLLPVGLLPTPLSYWCSLKRGLYFIALQSGSGHHSPSSRASLSFDSRALLHLGAGPGSCKGLRALEETSASSCGPASAEFQSSPYILPVPT